MTQTLVRPELSALVVEYFDTLYVLRDYRRHFEMHAADTLVLAGPQAVLRASVGPDDYAEVLDQIALLRLPREGELLREPSFGAPRVIEARVDGDEAVLEVEVTEGVSGRTVPVGFALRFEGSWKVQAVAILPGEGLPGHATLVAMGLAEFAQVPRLTSAEDLYLGPLELAYRRLYTPFDLPLASLPESRFTCQDSGHCCGPQWGVQVNGNTQLAVEMMPMDELEGVELGGRFELDAKGDQKLDTSCGTCVFHRGGGCAIHRHAGWAPISTCFTFPIVFTQTPEGLCVSASFACPSARGNVGQPFSERSEDFAMRARATGDYLALVPDEVLLHPDGPNVSYEAYRRLETAWLAALDRCDRPLGDRLGVCLALLEAARRTPVEQWERVFAAGLEVPEVASDVSVAIHPHGLGLYVLLKRQLPSAFEGLEHLSDLERMQLPRVLADAGIRFDADDELLTRYVRQLLWRKALLSEVGATHQLHAVLLAFALIRSYAMFLAYKDARTETSAEDVAAAVNAVEIATLHTDHLRRVIHTHPEMAHLMNQAGMARYLLGVALG